MRLIPTRIHGFLDYAVGILLVFAPWLFGFAAGGAETWVPVILGLGAIAYSLFTDYELGVIRTIPMTTHLGLDAGSGVILTASPWIFGFADLVYLPHLIPGLLEISAALTTRTSPYVESRPAEESRAHGGRPRVWSMVEPVKDRRDTDDMNWSQARDRIDRGETGDKKAVEDPAAAPLGTDAEAGGSSTGGEHVARSAAAEEAGPRARAAAQGRAVARPHRTMIVLGLVAMAAASVIIALALTLTP